MEPLGMAVRAGSSGNVAAYIGFGVGGTMAQPARAANGSAATMRRASGRFMA